MKDYSSLLERTTMGRTPKLCQQALCEMLEELFEGKKYIGQEGRKALKVFAQDLPIPSDCDEDVDTDAAAAPYIVVNMTGGSIPDDNSPQLVTFSLVVCAYDTSNDRVGYDDVSNITEEIIQRVCSKPYFGGCFTILKPVSWAMQQDDTMPYYYSAVALNVTAPVMTQEAEMKELI